MTQSPKGWREIADVRLKYDLFLNYVAPSGLKIIFEGRYPPAHAGGYYTPAL
jgi:hypothetical protein